MIQTTADAEKTSTQYVLEAAIDLYNLQQLVTPKTLAQVLPELTLGKINDRLGYLVESNQMTRLERGVYVPVIRHAPSRPISKYILPDGMVKIEIGDDVIILLTPRESRYLGNVMVAEAMQFSNIELGQNMAKISGQMSNQVRKLSMQVEKMSGRRTGDLFDEC